jgi:uncharacterized SAM-binding protein YcdF (DUF218 family)
MTPLRAAFARHQKALVSLSTAGALYCAAIEVWLPRIDPVPADAPDLVIALSSGVEDDGRLMRNGVLRLRKALEFAQERNIALFTTRVRNENHPEITSDGDQRRMIDSAGRGKQWVQLEGLAVNTRDEAQRLRKVMSPTRIALVTSRLHTRRACLTFERLGYRVTCMSSGLDGPPWKIPYNVAYESAAWIKYKMKGWI